MKRDRILKLSIFREKWLWTGGVFYLLIFCLSAYIPFFGDETTIISYPANYFFDNNFRSLIIPQNFDTGHPPFYSLLLAFTWSVFGKSLFVSHLLFNFFALTAFYQFYFLCKKVLKTEQIKTAVILFLFEPTVVSQIVLMSTDIILILFFLTGLNAMLSGKKYLLVISITGMLLTSTRGIILTAALFFIILIIYKKYSFKSILRVCMLFFVASIPFVFWSIYHYSETGWILSHKNSPWVAHRQITDMKGFFTNTGIYILRTIEFGMLLVWLVIFIYFRKTEKGGAKLNMFIILCVLSILLAAFMLPFANPIQNRYVLPLQIIALLVFAMSLPAIQSKVLKTVLCIFVFLFFISSHFYIYPEKTTKQIGYSWDATLAILPYLTTVRENMDERLNKLFEAGAINTTDKISAGFPEYQSYRDTNLKDAGYLNTIQLDTLRIENSDYIIYSNIMNEIPWGTTNKIKRDWKLLYETKKGNIYMQLYKNPAKIPSRRQ